MCGVSNGPGQLKAGGALLRNVASNLSAFAGRPVLDRTGLTGTFDVELTWAMQLGPAAAGPQDGPSLFTAVQEQLGLKLEAQETPMEVLVVERVEIPTEN